LAVHALSRVRLGPLIWLAPVDSVTLATWFRRTMRVVPSVAARAWSGARGLATVLERLLEELSFHAPGMSGVAHEVDAAEVDQRLGELSRNEDLSRFIL